MSLRQVPVITYVMAAITGRSLTRLSLFKLIRELESQLESICPEDCPVIENLTEHFSDVYELLL